MAVKTDVGLEIEKQFQVCVLSGISAFHLKLLRKKGFFFFLNHQLFCSFLDYTQGCSRILPDGSMGPNAVLRIKFKSDACMASAFYLLHYYSGLLNPILSD